MMHPAGLTIGWNGLTNVRYIALLLLLVTVQGCQVQLDYPPTYRCYQAQAKMIYAEGTCVWQEI